MLYVYQSERRSVMKARLVVGLVCGASLLVASPVVAGSKVGPEQVARELVQNMVRLKGVGRLSG